MSISEMVIYFVWLITNVIIAWQMATYGIMEIGIMRPPNTKAWCSVFVGMTTMLLAGYAERAGLISLSLIREEVIPKTIMLAFGIPLLVFFAGRYFILPKGLPEFNRARIRILHWIQTHYRPGEILEERGSLLKNFWLAQNTLVLLDRSIEHQRRGIHPGPVINKLCIDEEQIGYDGMIEVGCPNCPNPVRVPVQGQQGFGACSLCDIQLGFKIHDGILYLSAFGKGLRGNVTPENKRNIATAHGEKGFLLRMMNDFSGAKREFESALKYINQALLHMKNDKMALGTKSLIIYRMGELAHISGKREAARQFYQESLTIDEQIGDESGRAQMEYLIQKVSQ